MSHAEHKSMSQADEVRTFSHGRLEVVNIGGASIGRIVLEPGWRWSEHVKPIVNTEFCEAPHFQYHVSGRLHVKMTGGEEFEIGPGEVSNIPPGHDAWVVG